MPVITASRIKSFAIYSNIVICRDYKSMISCTNSSDAVVEGFGRRSTKTLIAAVGVQDFEFKGLGSKVLQRLGAWGLRVKFPSS